MRNSEANKWTSRLSDRGERKESRKKTATLTKEIFFFFNEHGDYSQKTLVLFLSAETAAWNAQEVKSQTEMFLEARQVLL